MQSLPQSALVSEVELQTPSPVVRRPWLGWLGLFAILIGFGAFIWIHFAPAITEPDDNGYFAQATRWVRGGTTWFRAGSDAEYIGMHWLWDDKGTASPDDDQFISRYPPGLPALIALFYSLGGYEAAMWVNPVLAAGSLIGLYFTARRLIPIPWALAGVALLATNPTFVNHTLAGDSHMAVTFVLIWGTGLLLLWSQQGRLWQIFAAGLVLGCIPSIRYPDSLVALGVGAFILWHAKSQKRFWTHLGVAVAGAMIPILPLLIRNQLTLGGFWKTGYALTNEQTGFSFAYFKQHAIQYIQIIQGDGLGIVFALGLVGLTWMICIRRSRAMGVMLTLFVVPMLMLYMAYYWAPGGNAGATMRFLLPTFPIYILAGVWMLASATRLSPRTVSIIVPIVLIGFQLLWGTSDMMQRVNRMSSSKRALTELTEGVRGIASRDDVVISTAAFLQQADFVREWKMADLTLLRGAAGPGGMGRMMGADGDQPSPMQAEKAARQRSLYTGGAQQKMDKFAADVVTWAGPKHKVYIVCPESDLRASFGKDNAEVTVVKKITFPRQPQTTNNRSGFGGPGGGGPPGAGGPGGNRGGGGGGGGGMFGMNTLAGNTWVIAEWTPSQRGI